MIYGALDISTLSISHKCVAASFSVSQLTWWKEKSMKVSALVPKRSSL